MLLFLVAALGFRKPELLTAAFLCLSPVVLVNRQLYAFYERARGPWFAVRVIPVHVLYYVLNGVAVGFGWFLHEVFGGPSPDPIVQARSEIGLKTWPPVPTKRSSPWR